MFHKAGHYIVNIGLVNFFEYLVINLLLLIHAAKAEERTKEFKEHLSFFEENVSILNFMTIYRNMNF